MRIVVLLSAGVHPVSRRPAPVETELQAIGLGLALGGTLIGLHAGPDDEAAREYAGFGVAQVQRLDLPRDSDPFEPLTRALQRLGPDLVLAGRRGMGGIDSGMLPYRLAHALRWPLVPDAVGIAPQADGLAVQQFRPHGARRVFPVRAACMATVHPAAPPPPQFVFARRRSVPVPVIRAEGPPPGTNDTPEPQERPYRFRPKVIPTGSASAGRVVLTDVTPEKAAAEILAYLDRAGFAAGSEP